jgi:hypothetical protein
MNVLLSITFPYMLSLLTRVLAIVLVLTPTSSVYAQGAEELLVDDAALQFPSILANQATGNLACFDYYQFGSVQADLQTNLTQTVPGAIITFAGNVSNANRYPLVDGTLFVKIFKQDETTFAAGDGNLVVDQFVINNDIAIPANGQVPLSFNWQVPNQIEGGEYYAAYFFATNERYNLMGLSFTDDVVGNTAPFSIVSDNLATKLSKVDTTLNDRNHNFAAFPLTFSATETVTVRTTITNQSDKERTIPLQWNQYAWDAMNPDNRRNTKTEIVTLAPNETKEVNYTAKEQREPVVYITALTQDNDAKSLLNIRYVRDGIPETRINFPSITSFPLAANNETTLFACAHSTNVPLVPGNTLTLNLKDAAGNTIHEYTYTGDISATMSGFGNTFTPDRSINYALLTATLEREGVVVEEVQIEYDCSTIPNTECLPEADDGTTSTLVDLFTNPNTLYPTLIGLFLLLLIGAIVYRQKHKRINIIADDITTPLSILFLLLIQLTVGLMLPTNVEARSVQWTWSGGQYYYRWDNQVVPPFSGGWSSGLSNPIGSITYHAQLINRTTGAEIMDGSTVPINTEVCVQPQAHQSSDISWFGSGGSLDSPNGDWIPNANPPGDMPGTYRTSCDARYYVGTTPQTTVCTGFNCGIVPPFGVYIPLTVNPPTKTFSASANMQDIGGGCYRLTDPGAGTASLQAAFEPTFGRYYYRYYDFRNGGPYNRVAGCYRDTLNSPMSESPTGSPVYQLQVPRQTISFNLNVSGVNNPPNAPVITGAVTSGTNRSESFTFTASDPNNDTIRYGVDWDNNGSVDAWLPGTGYVPSGTGRGANRSWSSIGNYSFQALTEDSNGVRSGWTTHAISISNNCTVPTGAVTPYGTEAQIIDNCAFTAGNAFTGNTMQLTRPADFTSAYVIYQDTWDSFGITYTGERLQVCHNSPNTFLFPMNCTPGGGIAGVFTPQSWCAAAPSQQCNFNSSSVDLKVNSSDGPLNVNKVDSLVLSWTHSNVGTCTIFGDGLPGGVLNNVGADDTYTIPGGLVGAGTETYLMSCTTDGDSVSVTLQNQPPSAPTITGGTSAPTDESIPFNFTATDPDNDQIYYEIDWDNNGTVDANTPASSYVNSGTTLSGNRSWPSTGTYTIQARTVDFDNTRSSWTDYSVTIVPGPPPVATLEVQVGTGGWGTGNPPPVDTNDTVALRWVSSRAASCSGSNFSTGGNTSSTGLGVTTPAPGGSTTFTLTCTGSGGTDSKSITVSAGLPNFNQPIVTHTLSTTFNPATGAYDYIDVRFQTTNNGVSGTTNTAPYSVRFDSRAPVAGTIPLLTRGSVSPNFTERITSVPFGTHSATIVVDSAGNPGAVQETNENDNSFVYNFGGVVAPPDPGLSISVSQPVVRAGETVVVSWNTNSTYPMNCSVFGPSFGPINFDPSVSGANDSRPSQPINAKSEFTLRCIEPITNTTFTTIAVVETVGQIEEI